jgi:hypothetical protein
MCFLSYAELKFKERNEVEGRVRPVGRVMWIRKSNGE